MEASGILSEAELKINLYALKEILNQIELFPIKNVFFYDINSYYLYIEDYYNFSIDLSHIMKILEPYIPLSLCIDDKLCEKLLLASQSNEIKEISKIKKDFFKNAVFLFLNKLKTSNSDDEINCIFNLCNNLRIMQI